MRRHFSRLRLAGPASVALLMVGLGLSMVAAADPGRASSDLWQALATPGHFAMMRHAVAPGTGDPAAFTLDDCGTQRNLDARGREQARKIGARFREHGIAVANVFSSQWCRCMDTARLLDLGAVTPLPSLNSFFRDRQKGPGQTATLTEWLAGRDLNEPLVLVTHQVNITALTGDFVSSGEIKVLRRNGDGSLTVLGAIETDAR